MRETVLVNVGPLLAAIIEGHRESHGVHIAERLPRTIFRLPKADGLIFRTRNLRLVETEARRIAEDPKYRGHDVWAYHSTAVYDGREIGHPSSKGDLREIVLHVTGHVVEYQPTIGFLRIDKDGKVWEFHSASLTPIDISVRKLTMPEIDEWISGIPDAGVAEAGPGGMPLTQGAFAELVEGVSCDQALYTTLMGNLIREWGVYK